MKSLAEKISDARYTLGISQTELGDKVGVSLRSILAYEKGESTPRKNVILKLAKELGVSESYAYKLVRKLNKELEETGCIVIAGRIDRKFFHEKLYGTRNQN